jgi:hypothetical protein
LHKKKTSNQCPFWAGFTFFTEFYSLVCLRKKVCIYAQQQKQTKAAQSLQPPAKETPC